MRVLGSCFQIVRSWIAMPSSCPSPARRLTIQHIFPDHFEHLRVEGRQRPSAGSRKIESQRNSSEISRLPRSQEIPRKSHTGKTRTISIAYRDQS